MKNKMFAFALLLLVAPVTKAQQFINKGSIEFEVTTNVKKTMGNESYLDELKATMPTFKTAYYKYIFADNKSIYKFDHYDEKKAKMPEFLTRGEDDNNWYTNFTAGEFIKQKSMWGTLLNLKDSIVKIDWKISNESRMIAGFNCRKAVGKILDSVYVFAFYTDEITISGGPCTINGLPGMIMGVTIPRLYVSMLATKLSVTDVKEAEIKPVLAKKYYTTKELNAVLDKRIKDDFANQEITEDTRNEINNIVWGTLL